MASIVKKRRKRGTTWYISYRVPNDTGVKRQIWLRCANRREALDFLEGVEEAEKKGVVYIPKAVYASTEASSPKGMTIAELMEEYIRSYGVKNWEPSTLKTNRAIVRNYIIPFIGNILVASITPKFVQDYYDDLPSHLAKPKHLQKTPPKQISARTCKEVHKILRPALDMAVVWGEVSTNPTLSVKLPKQSKYMREFWTESELEHALSVCDDELLYLCICLVFGCSLRSGELAGLTWANVMASKETIILKTSSIYIDKTMQRVYKSAIHETGGRDIIQQFPNVFGGKSTVMALKKPKTESSIRRIFLPSTVARLLLEHKVRQERLQALLGGRIP